MTPSSLSHLPLLLVLAAAIANALQHYVRINDRLARTVTVRDENFIDTPGTPQNLCGDSTFVAVDNHGPVREDCKRLANTVTRNPNGFWMASRFGSDGTSWVEFTRLRTCGIEIRRTDGQGGDVPFGDEDVVDLVNSVLTKFSDGRHLPTVEGQTACRKDDSSATVEWQIFAA